MSSKKLKRQKTFRNVIANLTNSAYLLHQTYFFCKNLHTKSTNQLPSTNQNIDDEIKNNEKANNSAGYRCAAIKNDDKTLRSAQFWAQNL